MSRRWSRADFAFSAQVLGTKLLGGVLVRVMDDGTRIAGRIVETEAYVGVKDRASHAYGGRRTVRTEPMFAPAGTAYVYFTYGMHYCMNVVCGKQDEPVAVLLRALEPTEGLVIMQRYRTIDRARGVDRPITELCSGPARLCQALGIDRQLNQTDLVTSSTLFIEHGEPISRSDVLRGPRIGIRSSGVWAGKPLRYGVCASPSLSVKFPER